MKERAFAFDVPMESMECIMVDSSIDPMKGFLIDPMRGFLIDRMRGFLIDPMRGFLIDPMRGFLIGSSIDSSTDSSIDSLSAVLLESSASIPHQFDPPLPPNLPANPLHSLLPLLLSFPLPFLP